MNFQERSARSIPSDTRVAIYGAGELGRAVKNYLETRGRGNSVTCFIDSFKEGEFCGLPVVQFQKKLEDACEFDVIVIASQYAQDIVENLQSEGIVNYIVLDKEKFINYDLNIREFNELQLRCIQSRQYLPSRVVIQLSSVCNLKCKMCPHTQWGHEKPFMDKDTYLEVLDECEKNKINNLSLVSSRGESLLNKNIFEYARIGSQRGFNLYFVTNAVLLNAGNMDELLESGFSAIDISFSGHDKESYENIYVGASFDHTVECLLLLKSKVMKMKTPPILCVRGTLVDYDHRAKERSVNFLKGLGFADSEISINLADNFSGGSSFGTYYPTLDINSLLPINDRELTICSGLDVWVVYTDGLVGPCGCRNYRKLSLLGDIKLNSFEEMAAGEVSQSLVESFLSGNIKNIELCRKCDIPYRRG
ncbi:radical SAM protein [Maridesulfovibrio frigidus]|uniref:radical SAM protein n=1 Tax=Maridesulfovibrio frigidus TaxID=340956 RepID=UPI0004E16478|nr:radical SAM protein [Maridesulfovibrio frigidus]